MATSSGYQVIVGGLGALGHTLQKSLLQHGKSKIRVVDIAPPDMAAQRLTHPSIEYLRISPHGTDTDFSSLCTAFRDAETVYSVATGDVLRGTAADMYNTNVRGIKELLSACERVGVPKFIHASSMGVTNQLLDHDDEDETTPLPPWETYRCAYDLSKRQGEDLVVKATSPNFQTGILRLGVILAGTSDYATRSALLTRPGTVTTARRQPVDLISSWDISGAMLAANDKLDASDNRISGKPLFVTKCKYGQPAGTHEVGALYAEQLGWKLQETPGWLIDALQYGFSSFDAVKSKLFPPTPENTAAFPFHLQLQAGKNRLTFRNNLAHELLDWQPQETWMDAVKRISVEFREEYPQYKYR